MNKPKGLKESMLSTISTKKEESVKEQALIQKEENELEDKRTFSIPLSIIENLERKAYWEHKTLKDALVEILEAYYKANSFDPIPTTYKKPKRGKPKKK